ncbi:MFS transporter [Actinoplanes couchii]|uniref:MFS transporter n=1 Tax=Actinoplanes couchii TaxID=403638 RepID=A0ABQ3XT90_9ACTN|nr:MFS transporter [Actinoplanes couchii]MDR6317017.1 MFS family permease [Actinoplanes couchii]GID61736.1 MFS transporter [Actinoplanes couchii]
MRSAFRRFWIGQTASQLGEHSCLVILPLIAVISLDVGGAQLGALRAAGQVPVLLVSLLAGAGMDRWRARTVLVTTDLIRAAALIAVAVAALTGTLGLPMLAVAAFTVGTMSVFFDVAYHVYLVRLLPRDRLPGGTSAVEGSRSAAQIGGPALGGTLVSLLSPPVAVLSGAVFFTLSALAIGGIPWREPAPPPTARGRIRDGIRFVARNPVLRTVALASAAFQFFLAGLMTAYLTFLTRELHLDGTAVGLSLAAAGPGALLGSLLAARFGYGVVLVTAAAAGDGVMLFLPVVHGPPAVTVPLLMTINFLFGTFGQLVNVTATVVRQSVTPAGLQGRVAATITFAGLGPAPLGSVLGGLSADHHGLRLTLLGTAAGMLLSPILMARSPLGRWTDVRGQDT